LVGLCDHVELLPGVNVRAFVDIDSLLHLPRHWPWANAWLAL